MKPVESLCIAMATTSFGWTSLWHVVIRAMCIFREGDIETTKHLFFVSCSHTQFFCKQFMESSKTTAMLTIDHYCIIIGVLLEDNKYDLMVIVLQMLAKFFIHKGKCIKTQPIFTCYYNGTQLYVKYITVIIR